MQKFLARSGVAARRAAEELIKSNRVTVNGRVVSTVGSTVDALNDDVRLDGRRIKPPVNHVYILLNKPVGVMSTVRDPQGRPTVLALVPTARRVFPVGRLDYDSAGLLLLTDDGEMAARLMHPRHGVEKVYRVQAEGEVGPVHLDRLREGVRLADGPTAPAGVRVLRRERQGALIEITLREGRNRQVRRMCSAVGLRVRSLVRTRFGPLRSAGLSLGGWRELTPNEVQALQRAVE